MFVRAVYTERTDMEKARTDVLYYALKEKGYPDDFCREIAYKQMNTDYTATRMLGYLYRVSNPRVEDLVDEMLAILSDRQQIIQKKEMEQAQAVMNDVYRNGLQKEKRLWRCMHWETCILAFSQINPWISLGRSGRIMNIKLRNTLVRL